MAKMAIFKTSDQGLAAYIMLLGYTCIGAIPTEEQFTNHLGASDHKMDFVFIEVDDPGQLTQDYMENKAIGKLQAFHKNTQRLRWLLRNPMSYEEYKGLKQ